MPHYLTNINKIKGLAEKVKKASELSGQDVRYEDKFIPDHRGKRYAYAVNFASIVGYEQYFDYSKFWAEWRKLK